MRCQTILRPHKDAAYARNLPWRSASSGAIEREELDSGRGLAVLGSRPCPGAVNGAVNAPAADPPVRARPRRWVRRVLFGLAGLVLLVALAPFYVGPLLGRFMLDAIEQRLDAEARVQSVSFAWPARLHVRKLELADASGAPLATLDELHAALALGPLLSGKIQAEVELVYPELHLARARDGRWNWEHALDKTRLAEEQDGDTEPAGSVPELKARLSLVDGHVVIHGREGETTLGNIALEVGIDGLERPAPFRLSLEARGPAGPAGRLSLEGSFTAASGGRIDPSTCAGDVRLALETLDLSGFAPALGLLAPIEGLAGVLDGRAAFTLGAGLALEGTTELELTELVVRGPLPGAAPARIARLELHGQATQQGEGTGSQHLELRAESFLALVYEGRSSLPARGAGSVAGTLTFSAELARLTEIARGWVPLQPGVEVHGRVEHVLELEAVLAERAPVSASLRARGGIEGLAGRDATGRALDLAELQGIALEFEAAADLVAGTLRVPKFSVRAGPLSCAGNLECAGLAAGGALGLRAGALQLEADLEKLRGTLAQVLALDGLSFGGRLSADATLVHRNQALELTASLAGHALAFAETSLAELHGELSARRADQGGLSGSGSLRLGALRARVGDAAPLELPGVALELGFQEDATGRGEHTLGLRTEDGAITLSAQAKSVRVPLGEFALSSSFRLDGRVARLAELAAAFTPVQPGLAGDLGVQGEVYATLAGTELVKAGGKSELLLTSLSARDAAGQALPLEALARTTVGAEGEFDARAGRAELRSFALDTGGLKLRGSGSLLGLGARAADAVGGAEIEQARFELEADLERLGRELARVVDLGGWTVGGSPLTAEVRLSTQAQRLEASGRLGAARVHLSRPADAPIELAALDLDFDLGYDMPLGSLHVRRAALRSETATLALTGTLNELAAPEKARGAMQLELAGRLERILADLGLETPESGRRTSGALTAKFALEGDRGAFRVTGRSALAGFRLELAPAAEGEPASVVEEPSIVLECEAGVTLAALDVELTKLTLEAGLARGGAQGRIENLRALGDGEVRFVGLAGELAYVPDRLGVVLAPFLPGKLSGAEEQRVTFTLDGRARDFELMTLLAGTAARVDLGIGRFERPEIQLGGALVMESKDEKLLVRGDLSANGGTLQLDGALDLGRGEKPRSRLSVKAKALRANPGLAPLLALLHPAFGTAQLARGSLDGLLGLDLDLAYDGPLTLAALAAGWEALPKEPLHGSGRLELAGASLRGSPLLALLSDFGVDTTRELDLRPIEFTIQAGRVTYAKPWTWTLAGTATSFTGSLGLDQSLDLDWSVPITDKLIERWSFLAALKGENLSIPLRGSVKKPRLEVDELLKDMAAKAAKAELASRLGLGDKSGGEDPNEILTRADGLWSKGQKVEAAALYSRLREEFKLSLTYALNKDRIKERSKYQDGPK